jgi:hypothetical protein
MPTLTRWYVRSSLLWLALALVLGAVLAARGVFGSWLPDAVGALQPVYFHLLMVGWVTQLIFGVVYWLFPKPADAIARRSERLGWLTWGALNLGLALRALAEPLVAAQPTGALGGLLALSALLQLAAGWLFVATTWPRVRVR